MLRARIEHQEMLTIQQTNDDDNDDDGNGDAHNCDDADYE